jgi:hypothetical protein
MDIQRLRVLFHGKFLEELIVTGLICIGIQAINIGFPIRGINCQYIIEDRNRLSEIK